MVELLHGGTDLEFVQRAYRVLLRRESDPTGRDDFLARLREGYTRGEILGSIRYSPEGRMVGRRVPGLRLGYWRARWSGRIGRWLGRIITRSLKDTGIEADSVRATSRTPGDVAFIEGAYWRFLNRAPDPVGLDAYLSMLARGMPHQAVLGMIRASPEAIAAQSGALRAGDTAPHAVVPEPGSGLARTLTSSVETWTARIRDDG